jgi:hypothetical protein
MQKKEGQHVSLVPAARIKLYLHWHFIQAVVWKPTAAIRCLEFQSGNVNPDIPVSPINNLTFDNCKGKQCIA